MPLRLTGLDGNNPLGFLAALGTVACVGGRLHWEASGTRWLPVVSDLGSEFDSPATFVDELDRKLRPMPFAYRLAPEGEEPYDDFKEKRAEANGTSTRSARPVRAVTEDVLRAAIAVAAANAEELERIAAHTCVVALRKANPECTAARSSSGQVRYLANLRDIVTKTQRVDIYHALFETWRYRKGPKLGLDPAGYIQNVSWNIDKLRSVGVIGAERLALEGLRGLPTSFSRGRLITRGYAEGKRFRWALSSAPRTFRATSDLLGSSHLFDSATLRPWMTTQAIEAVNESAVYHYGQGYKTLRPSTRVG